MKHTALLQQAIPGLTAEQAEAMLQHSRETQYPADTVLCREGEVESTFYVIVSGEVAVLKWQDFANTERLLRHLGAGEFFGEMAIIQEMPRRATIRTTQESRLLEVERQKFLEVLEANPRIASSLMQTVLSRLREMDQMQFNELREHFDALQRLDQAKTDFIEVVAHELRTPLAVIQGYGKLVKSSMPQDASMGEVLEGLQEGIDRMLHVVNAMLDISRIDNKTMKVQRVPMLPKMLLTEAMNTFHKALEARRISVTEQHSPLSSHPFIYADPSLLNKVFYQLLSNAIKYTPDGGNIEIRTEQVEDEAIGTALRVSIQDSGVGIPPERLPMIFEKFYQGGDVRQHSSSKTAFMGGGLGLGLAIARGIIEAHGGDIRVESSGEGQTLTTTFQVLLPIGEAPTPSQ